MVGLHIVLVHPHMLSEVVVPAKVLATTREHALVSYKDHQSNKTRDTERDHLRFSYV